MAYDRCVAICNPLRYTSIMTRPVCLILLAAAWASGALCILPGGGLAWLRPYCGHNVVHHGWCDPSSVRRLVCADTRVDNILSLSLAPGGVADHRSTHTNLLYFHWCVNVKDEGI